MTNSPTPTPPPPPSPYVNPSAAPQMQAPHSVAALVLGIIGLVVGICALIAMILGFKGRTEVAEAPPGTYKTGMLTAGWVLGIIGTILWVVGMIYLFSK